MPQALIFLSPEAEKKLKILKRKWKMSKSDALQKIVNKELEKVKE